jgi:hypothetical protein
VSKLCKVIVLFHIQPVLLGNRTGPSSSQKNLS